MTGSSPPSSSYFRNKSKGFGRLAMDRVEQLAKETYGCKEIILDTIARWAVYDKAWQAEHGLLDALGGESRSMA